MKFGGCVTEKKAETEIKHLNKQNPGSKQPSYSRFQHKRSQFLTENRDSSVIIIIIIERVLLKCR